MDEFENQQRPVEIFISYSRKDRIFKDKLLESLSDLERGGAISFWDDRQLVAGDEWDPVIDQHIDRASIILLLISPDYLDSDPCQHEERRARERHREQRIRVIPILLRDLRPEKISHLWFVRHLHCIPEGLVAIAYQTDENKAWQEVKEELRRAVEVTAPLPSEGNRINDSQAVEHLFGRETEVGQVWAALNTKDQGVRRCAIVGPGGIGKTALALEYAARQRVHLYWLNAQSNKTVEQSLSLHPQRTIAEIVRKPKNLLFFDDASGPEIIIPYIPSEADCQVLVTSRNTSWENFGGIISLEPLPLSVGARILLTHTSSSNTLVAAEIAEMLRGSPLLITQAALRIKAEGRSLPDYRNKLERCSNDILQTGRVQSDEGEKLARVWEVIVSSMSSNTHDLLDYLACLSSHPFPKQDLNASVIQCLRKFSLIDEEDTSISLMKPVREVIRAGFTRYEEMKAVTRALGLLRDTIRVLYKNEDVLRENAATAAEIWYLVGYYRQDMELHMRAVCAHSRALEILDPVKDDYPDKLVRYNLAFGISRYL